MKLPKQAAPVERIAPTSAVSQHSGVEASSVEASALFDDILRGVETAQPIITTLAPLALAAMSAGV